MLSSESGAGNISVGRPVLTLSKVAVLFFFSGEGLLNYVFNPEIAKNVTNILLLTLDHECR